MRQGVRALGARLLGCSPAKAPPAALQACVSEGALTAHVRPQLPQCARTYALGAAATSSTVAAGGATVLRILGYEVPYSWVLGVSLAAGAAGYVYGLDRLYRQDRAPLDTVTWTPPSLPEGVKMTDQEGRKVDVAQTLQGRHALLAFDSLQSGSGALLEAVAKAAEGSKQRTGVAITPVIISLDDVSTPELKRAAGRSGCPTTMVLAGHPAALLRCAERYKNKVTAAQQAAQADREERMKKGKDMESAGFVSDYVYLVDPGGRLAGLFAKKMMVQDLVAALAQEIQRTSVRV